LSQDLDEGDEETVGSEVSELLQTLGCVNAPEFDVPIDQGPLASFFRYDCIALMSFHHVACLLLASTQLMMSYLNSTVQLLMSHGLVCTGLLPECTRFMEYACEMLSRYEAEDCRNGC
jgi:hypothetical protein